MGGYCTEIVYLVVVVVVVMMSLCGGSTRCPGEMRNSTRLF